ncbi:progestin and adipoQ receptor family member 4-like [Dendronephthya gigantea]|uniref:progestin and adipoQ receptor family member 4-like n=1 Tax=Dendronephthya gigantea TaxID=151771 RepID=UPI001069F93C|nr:progestin and adipoQ receptor family member 4-like [Dendronephthya gigantea]
MKNQEGKSDRASNGSTQIAKPKSNCKCHAKNGLHHYNCLPEHLRNNQYVRTGYRVNLSTWECIKSLFYLHNESFNVYSHGLAAILLVLLSPYVYGKISHLEFDPILYPVHHITSTTCVLFSAIYHLMSCHEGGKPFYNRVILLDYFGILLVTGLSCITFLKATFFCYPRVRIPVTTIYFLLGFVSLMYIKKGTDAETRTFPLLALGTFRMFALYPVRCIMTTLGCTTGPLSTIWYAIGIEMVGLFASIINFSCFPEKVFVGKLDYFFNSHNIMHLFILIGPAVLHSGTVMDFEWMQLVECPM